MFTCYENILCVASLLRRLDVRTKTQSRANLTRERKFPGGPQVRTIIGREGFAICAARRRNSRISTRRLLHARSF